MKAPHVVQVSVNPNGGVPKTAVPEALLHREGVQGDRQRDRRFHGGPERAVCLFSFERIEALRAQGHPIGPGTTGENLTLAGVSWTEITPGRRLQVGDALLELTSYAAPCRKISGSFADGEFTRMSQKLHPGTSRVYARVLTEGVVRPGDTVTLL